MSPVLSGRLKTRLAANEQLGLVWLTLGHASITEMAAHSGADALVIDLQHGLWDRRSLETTVGIAAGTAPVIARVADSSTTAIGNALDAGCDGVLVPLIESREQAEQAISAARFPPQGHRSGGGVRPLAMGFGTYLERAGHVAVGLMIETAAGVDQAEAIITTPGLDFVLIGTGDLGISYAARGKGGDATEAGCLRVKEACASAGVPCGIFTGAIDKALERRAEGYHLVVLASDVDVVRDAFNGVVREFAGAAS